jgi:DNA-binding NarL/FixJ family response regulator
MDAGERSRDARLGRAGLDEDLHGTRVHIISRRPEFSEPLARRLTQRGLAVRAFRSLDEALSGPPPHVVALDLGEEVPFRGVASWATGAIADVRARCCAARLLIVGKTDDSVTLTAFRAGVHGWVLPWEPLAAVESAVMTLARGGAAMSLPALALLLLRLLPWSDASQTGLTVAVEKGLTTRQIEVLRLAARGYTDREIADTLTLSVRTVNHHVADILQKLGCERRQDAVRLVFGQAPQGSRSSSSVGADG